MAVGANRPARVLAPTRVDPAALVWVAGRSPAAFAQTVVARLIFLPGYPGRFLSSTLFRGAPLRWADEGVCPYT
jgi:hypothetical protein